MILSIFAFFFFSCDGGLFAAHEEVVIKTYNTAPVEEIAKHTVIPPYYGCIIFKVPENVPIEAELSFELSIDINGTTYTETLPQGQVLVINNIPVGKVYPVRCTAFLPTGGAYAAGTAEAKVTTGKISNLDLVLRKILTVTFMNEGTVHETKTVLSGDSVIRPSNPAKPGFAFSGWYTEADGGVKFDFGNGVRESLTLYARWVIQSEFHGTNYTPLPAGTDGTAGTEWTYVLFGDWPQTIKADNVEVDETISIVVGMFTYYKGSDGAWYVKIKENARGNGYKYSDETEVARADANSYKYFKVEPIKWRVLTNNYNGNGKKLLLAENILVNMQYYSTNTNHSVGNFHPNNYKASEIRAYLNGISYTYTPYGGTYYVQDTFVDKGFLQTAFTEPLRSIIAEDTTVDNSAASTTDAGGNLSQSSYACDNTEDRIFLLSEKEVTTEDYGFAAYNVYKGDSNGTTVSSRIRMPTDFAKASGAYQYTTTEGYGGWWWLRSPSGVIDYKHYGRTVNYNGKADKIETVDLQYGGVVPALCIN